MKTGTLYVVATPIGNLDDLTHRAVGVLKSSDVIACEDTRHTGKLLDRYGIDRPTVSYHEHNEEARAKELLERLRRGESVALVSDAGTPLVSDPGYRIVRAAVQAGIAVVPIPGASAILGSLAASGLATDAFYFGGFLPSKQSARLDQLRELADLRATLVFFEAPHRILETLSDIRDALGDRPVVLSRELTKIHEEFLRGTPQEVAEELQKRQSIKGEMTLLIGKGEDKAPRDQPVAQDVQKLMDAGLSRMEAIKAVARRRGVPKSAIYDALTGSKNSKLEE